MNLFRMIKGMIPTRKLDVINDDEHAENEPQQRISAFSKILLASFFVITVLTIACSFILAILDKNPVSEVTNTVLHVFGVHLVAYSGKTAVERYGRSKYKIDEDGVPFELHESEGDEHDDHETD